MKRFLLLSLAFVPAAVLRGQTINFEDMVPSIGDSYVVSYAEYTDPGPSGQNQTWDFSGLVANSQNTLLVVNPSEQLGNESFPVANIAYVFEGGIAVTYSSVADNIIETVGRYLGSDIMTFPDHRTFLQFPMSYQIAYDDTYESLEDQGNETIVQEIGSSSFIVDGTGTLTTPAGTFSEVLRLRVETEIVRNVLLFGEVDQSFQFTQIEYYFVKSGFTTSLLNLSIFITPGGEFTSASYYESGTVGLHEQNLFSELTIYPVPSLGQLTVKFNLKASAPVDFDLFAIDGRLISNLGKHFLVKGANSVELEIPVDISPGVYLLQIQTAKGTETSKIVVE